jgi:hypothetical protein
VKLEFRGFDGGEDEQYAVWNKQLKKHEEETFFDDIDAVVDEDDYDYDEWN